MDFHSSLFSRGQVHTPCARLAPGGCSQRGRARMRAFRCLVLLPRVGSGDGSVGCRGRTAPYPSQILGLGLLHKNKHSERSECVSEWHTHAYIHMHRTWCIVVSTTAGFCLATGPQRRALLLRLPALRRAPCRRLMAGPR